jgi:hypothetical protein
VNDVLDREQEDTLAAAAAVAELLLTNDKVSEVQLVEVPHWNDGPPYYSGPKYRIIVIVSDAEYEQYLAWLAEPFTVTFQDGNDSETNPATWSDKRLSTVKEAAWATLGETVGEATDWSNAYYFFNQIELDGDNFANWTPDGIHGPDDVFDIVPLRRNWQEDAERLDDITGSYTDSEDRVVEYPIFIVDTDRQAPFWAFAADNYLVYDPNHKKFVSPS